MLLWRGGAGRPAAAGRGRAACRGRGARLCWHSCWSAHGWPAPHARPTAPAAVVSSAASHLSPRSVPSPQVVREHYLRDDIYSGSPLDPECPPEACKLSGEAPHYLLVDTNVALHQVGWWGGRGTGAT